MTALCEVAEDYLAMRRSLGFKLTAYGRLLSAFDIAVLRLIRVCIGDLQLGQLPKGGWRVVTEHEIESLGAAARKISTPAVAGKTR